jgi:hypothetical protein
MIHNSFAPLVIISHWSSIMHCAINQTYYIMFQLVFLSLFNIIIFLQFESQYSVDIAYISPDKQTKRETNRTRIKKIKHDMSRNR